MNIPTNSTNIFKLVPLDEVQKYWNRQPCHYLRSSQPVGTKKYFDEINARRYYVEPHIARFAQFEKWSGKRVLDLGCGMGTDTINFARAGAKVTAVELSRKSLELARQQAKLYGLTNKIKFYKADAERLSKIVPPEPYDLIYSMGVIHHTPSPKSVVRQIRQHYVNNDSILKIMLYHRWSWKALSILLTEGHGQFWRLDEFIARNSEAQTGCPVTYSYTRKSVRELLSGFDVIRSDIEFIFPYRIEEYKKHLYLKRRSLRILPQPLFRMLEKTIGWQLLITAKPSERVKT